MMSEPGMRLAGGHNASKLESSFRSQERVLADQMLAEDLKRARAIRAAAMEAKNSRSVYRQEAASATITNTITNTNSNFGNDTTIGWNRAQTKNVPLSPTSQVNNSKYLNSAYQSFVDTTHGGDGPMPSQSFGGTGLVSNAMVDENKMLRDRVTAKGSEVFELRRQVDKAMHQLREKDRVCSALQMDVKSKQREVDEHQRRMVESQTQIERLHDIMNRVRDEDDELHRNNAGLEERVRKAESMVRQLEESLADADDKQAQTAQDCEFRLNLIEESKQTLALENDQNQEELQAFACDLRDNESKISELEDTIRSLKMEKAMFEEEKEKIAQKTKEWHDEAERLRRVVDEKNRLNFEMRGEDDSKSKNMKLQLHELQSQVAALDVEKNTLAASKLDLTHEVNRLMRRAEEREEQVKRLLRHLEEKDQQIAELGPAMREAKRASAQALAERKKKTGQHGWRH
eukprot:m.59896 g.59896  ORF g.59896 m.59896 type:complete len:459 (-) comp22775_c1_seq1:374-1750(-)